MGRTDKVKDTFTRKTVCMARVLSKVTHLCIRIGSLQKLAVLHLVKRSSKFYKTRQFNDVFERPCLFSTLWATLIHPIPIIFFFNIIFPSTLWTSKWILSFTFRHQNRVCIYLLHNTCHMHRQTHSRWHHYLNDFGEECKKIRGSNLLVPLPSTKQIPSSEPYCRTSSK